MRRRRHSNLVVALLAWLAGCEAPPPAPALTPFEAGGRVETPTAAAIRKRLTNSENGLEVRRIVMSANADRQSIAQIFASYEAAYALSADTTARLRRNGLRLARIPVEQVDALVSALAGVSYDAKEWHGQVFEWRSLLDRPIDDAGQAVAVDGLVRRYERGEFRLMFRSWTVQMEDGPMLHLEMVPRRRLPKVNDLRRLLSEEAALGSSEGEQAFASLALDVHLQPQYAYVLLSESPTTAWPGFDGDPPGNSAAKGRVSPASRSRLGPFDNWETAAPPTLGELLLEVKREPPARGLLMFIPKIPEELWRSST